MIWSDLFSSVCSAMCVFNCSRNLHSSMRYATKTCIPWILQPPVCRLRLWCNATKTAELTSSLHHMLLDMHVLLISREKACGWTDFMFVFNIFIFIFFLSITNPLRISSFMQTTGRICSFCRSFHSWFNNSGHFNPLTWVTHSLWAKSDRVILRLEEEGSEHFLC